jgi:hypothetical protein
LTDDRLSYLLATWREWISAPEHVADLGYPSRAAGIRYRSGDDFDAMVDSMDRTMALAVDSAVDDLPLNERTSVYAVIVSGGRVWRLREPIDTVYERARGLLKIRLRARGIE